MDLTKEISARKMERSKVCQEDGEVEGDLRGQSLWDGEGKVAAYDCFYFGWPASFEGKGDDVVGLLTKEIIWANKKSTAFTEDTTDLFRIDLNAYKVIVTERYSDKRKNIWKMTSVYRSGIWSLLSIELLYRGGRRARRYICCCWWWGPPSIKLPSSFFSKIFWSSLCTFDSDFVAMKQPF